MTQLAAQEQKQPQKRPSRKWNVTLWVLQVVLALAYLAAGYSKLSAAEAAVVIFDRIGWGHWFMYLMGALEVVAAIGLLVPRLVRPAAIGLIVLIVVATVAHFAIGDANGAVFLVPLVMAVVVARGRSRYPTGGAARA